MHEEQRHAEITGPEEGKWCVGQCGKVRDTVVGLSERQRREPRRQQVGRDDHQTGNTTKPVEMVEMR